MMRRSPNRTFLHQLLFVKGASKWFKQGTWTVLDQGLFAGANFVLNIMLARWLTPEGYGTFTIAFTVFLLLGTLHTGFITEPMLVFGPRRFRRWLPAYLRTLLGGHMGLTLLFSIGLGIAGLVFKYAGIYELAHMLWMLALTQPFLLYLWLMRRACYIKLKPAWAASGGAVYLIVLILGLIFLYQSRLLTASTGLLLLASASLLAGLWMKRRLPRQTMSPTRRFKTLTRSRHWQYGRWAATTGLLQWFPGHIAFLVLPIWAGLSAPGALKALLNLVMPAAHIYGALSMLLLPMFVQAKGTPRFYRTVLGAIGLITLGTCLYALLMGYFGEPVMAWLYNGQYIEHTSLLGLVAILPIVYGIGTILQKALQALELPNKVFWTFLGSTALSLSAGLYLISVYGLLGALWGLLLQAILELGMLTFFLIHATRT